MPLKLTGKEKNQTPAVQDGLRKLIAIRFAAAFRSSKENEEDLSPPSGLNFTPEGHRVVTDDFNHRIQIYDHEHRLIRTFGSKGKKPGEFHYPRGTAVDGEGNIYVADSWNHRIQKFDAEGNPLSAFGTCGDGKGELNEPYALHIDPAGNLVVVERCNHRIQFFDPKGESLGWIGNRGTVLEEKLATLHETPQDLFVRPAFEFPTSITRDHRGRYYVSDSGNHRIVKFDAQWKEILAFGSQGDQPGQFQYPMCVAAGPNDLLYVADLNNDRVQVFTSEGHFLRAFSEGGDDTPIQAPCLTAIDPRGRLHVGLTFETKILTFETPAESQETLADSLLRLDPGNPRHLYLRGRLYEHSGDRMNALKFYTQALQATLSGNEPEESSSNWTADLLVTVLRMATVKTDGLEPLFLKGLDWFAKRLDEVRKMVLETHLNWLEAGKDFDEKALAENFRVLEQQDDPRVFNKDLYQAEKRERSLFRTLRDLFYVYRKTAEQNAECIFHALEVSDEIRKSCWSRLRERFEETVQLLTRLLDTKEKNEEHMVEAFGEMQGDQSKWTGFYTKYQANLRTMDLLKQVQFELRLTISNLKDAERSGSIDPVSGETVRRFVLDSPFARLVPKILLGFQEDWSLHNGLDIVWKDLVDTCLVAREPAAPPSPRDIGPDFFSPVPYNAEDLNLDDLNHILFMDGLPLKEEKTGIVCGNELFPLDTVAGGGEKLARNLMEIRHAQNTYEEKFQELFNQYENLSLELHDLHSNLNRVNVQDKKAPITLRNNLTIVQFQIGLLRRMILTLEINESKNLGRLIAGSALAGLLRSGEGPNKAETLFHDLGTWQSEVEKSIENLLQEQKTRTLDCTRLKNEHQKTEGGLATQNIDQALEIKARLLRNQLDLERLELTLDRQSKIQNRLDKLFEFLQAKELPDILAPRPSLRAGFRFSFANNGGGGGRTFYPCGLTHTPEGDLIVADHDNHLIYRFSSRGAHRLEFGGFGNSPGFLKYPVTVQVDGEGCIYGADEVNERVQKFDREGHLMFSLGDREPPEQRVGPIFSIAVDRENRVWVPDPTHHRIQIYDSQGQWVRSVRDEHDSKEHSFEPVSVCFLENGDYLAALRSGDMLKQFNAQGEPVRSLKRNQCVCGDLYFITADPKHGIFAADFWGNQILHLNSRLELLATYRTPGKRAGEFGRVAGLSIRDDFLMVADHGHRRVQVFKLPGGKVE